MLRNSYLWCDACVFQRTSWPRMQENVRSAWRSWYRETPSLACPASASTTKGMKTCDGKYSRPSVWERGTWALFLQRSNRNASTYISVKAVEFCSFAAGVWCLSGKHCLTSRSVYGLKAVLALHQSVSKATFVSVKRTHAHVITACVAALCVPRINI